MMVLFKLMSVRDGNLVSTRDPRLTGVADAGISAVGLALRADITPRHFPAERPTHPVQAADSAGTTNTRDHKSTRSRIPNFTSVRF